jgi:hypothetical protein
MDQIIRKGAMQERDRGAVAGEAEYRRRLDALRGTGSHERLNARDIAQIARNPQCDRLVMLRAARLDPAEAGRLAFGDERPDEGSQIALGNGVTFEKGLIRDDGARLFEMFRAAGRLTESDTRFVNIERHAPGKDPQSQARREALTQKFLRAKLAGAPDVPAIIYHGRLTLSVDGAPVVIEPDLLTAGAADPFYRPGEAKSYRDRGARTNPSDIATASLQGAVEVLALRDAVTAITGDRDRARALVGDTFDLVLRQRIGNGPRLRARRIRRELATMERLLGQMRGRVLRVLGGIPMDTRLDTSAGHLAVSNHLTEQCRSHCALAHRCEAVARAAGDPIVLGAAMADAVRVIGSLPRLAAMLVGRETPQSTDERRAISAFRDAQRVLDREVRRVG